MLFGIWVLHGIAVCFLDWIFFAAPIVESENESEAVPAETRRIGSSKAQSIRSAGSTAKGSRANKNKGKNYKWNYLKIIANFIENIIIIILKCFILYLE